MPNLAQAAKDPEEDFIGEDRHGSRFHAEGTSLNAYLLHTRVGFWARLVAWCGFRYCVGRYRAPGMKEFRKYYCFWCSRCEAYRVNQESGYEGRLDCPVCYRRGI